MCRLVICLIVLSGCSRNLCGNAMYRDALLASGINCSDKSYKYLSVRSIPGRVWIYNTDAILLDRARYTFCIKRDFESRYYVFEFRKNRFWHREFEFDLNWNIIAYSKMKHAQIDDFIDSFLAEEMQQEQRKIFLEVFELIRWESGCQSLIGM